MDILSTIIVAVIIAVVPIIIYYQLCRKEVFVTIRCKRCNYIGRARGISVLFRGIRTICPKCESEDWTMGYHGKR